MNAPQTSKNSDPYDVVILGAGYAGLMAAMRLSRRKWLLRVAVVSASDQFLERVRLQETIVAAVGGDGLVYVTANQGEGTPFGPWQQLSTEPAAGPPTLFNPIDEELSLDFVGQDGNLYNFYSALANTPTTLSFGGGKVCRPSGC